jgi:hypothetical protein
MGAGVAKEIRQLGKDLYEGAYELLLGSRIGNLRFIKIR